MMHCVGISYDRFDCVHSCVNRVMELSAT